MEETKENQKNGDNSPENKGSANEENQRFRRSNRGKRIQNLNEEQLKEDEAFWKNNPLFKDIEGN